MSPAQTGGRAGLNHQGGAAPGFPAVRDAASLVMTAHESELLVAAICAFASTSSCLTRPLGQIARAAISERAGDQGRLVPLRLEGPLRVDASTRDRQRKVWRPPPRR